MIYSFRIKSRISGPGLSGGFAISQEVADPPKTRDYMALSDAQTLVASAIVLMGTADWSGAESLLIQAEAEMSILPDAGSATHNLSFTNKLAALIETVRRKKNENLTSGAGAANTLRFSKVRWKSIGST